MTHIDPRQLADDIDGYATYLKTHPAYDIDDEADIVHLRHAAVIVRGRAD